MQELNEFNPIKISLPSNEIVFNFSHDENELFPIDIKLPFNNKLFNFEHE